MGSVTQIGKTKTATFSVPHTKSVLETMMNVNEWKLPDWICASIGFLNIFLFFYLTTYRVLYFTVSCIFWRLLYNIGLGFLLRRQSNTNFVVEFYQSKLKHNLVFQSHIFGKPQKDIPDEYYAWLCFRKLVDIILIQDIWCFVFLAFSAITPFGSFLSSILRIVISIGLIGIAIFVKFNGHKLIRDFAWYWGDFFFLIDGDLVFDGVFKLAPHPMYSIGYMGHYGGALLSSSYTVFFVALFTHASQILFLYLVEEPRIPI